MESLESKKKLDHKLTEDELINFDIKRGLDYYLDQFKNDDEDANQDTIKNQNTEDTIDSIESENIIKK